VTFLESPAAQKALGTVSISGLHGKMRQESREVLLGLHLGLLLCCFRFILMPFRCYIGADVVLFLLLSSVCYAALPFLPRKPWMPSATAKR
jgi:hypothetical protein